MKFLYLQLLNRLLLYRLIERAQKAGYAAEAGALEGVGQTKEHP